MRAKIVRPAIIWLATVICLWAYWPALTEIADYWLRKPEYSHGWMVALFALYILWSRRNLLAESGAQQSKVGLAILAVGGLAWLGPWLAESTGSFVPQIQFVGIVLSTIGFAIMVSQWIGDVDIKPSAWGLAFLIGAVGMRLAAAKYYFEWFDFLSLIPFICGIVLLTGGWQILRWSWIAVAFLFFMIPLPFRLEVAMRGPLQGLGTVASTYVMQTMGLPAFSEGHRVSVNDVDINIVEACSGLRMMMVFFALSVGMAIVMDRPLWQRLLIAGSAIPIALVTNITRIVTTGLLHVMGHHEFADAVFHDLAGWLMPLMGMALLGLELWYLDHLFIVDEKVPMSFGMKGHRQFRSGTAN